MVTILATILLLYAPILTSQKFHSHIMWSDVTTATNRLFMIGSTDIFAYAIVPNKQSTP